VIYSEDINKTKRLMKHLRSRGA